MKLVICSLGIHDWEIVCYAEYENVRAEVMAHANHRKRRVCKECGKTQEEDVHCLGLNPPKYTRHWENVPKVSPDNNGKTEIIVDGAGALIVCDEHTNRCYTLIPGNPLGGLEKQGPCTLLGEYAISYPR